ncbi:ADP-ribosylglycohydrolase family protein, partial [Streptomyces sp. NPDC056337]
MGTGRDAERGRPGGLRTGSGAAPRARAGVRRDRGSVMLRLTWVQPEDLIGHELRQAALEGRDASAVAARWEAAGGGPAPDR